VQQWRLAATARSVPEARRHVVAILEQWHLESLVDTAQLLTSELVTNAVLHARTDMVLTVEERDGGGVRIAVTDLSPVSPALRRHSATSTTGRGLRLLDQLADSWNVDDDNGGGKTVWFTLTSGRDPWADFGEFDTLAEAEA
jgi:anti-sigma regulatory factor (Ser/Thr protein kinase)